MSGFDPAAAAREMIARALDICDCGNPTDPTCLHCAPGPALLADMTVLATRAYAAGVEAERARLRQVVADNVVPVPDLTCPGETIHHAEGFNAGLEVVNAALRTPEPPHE